MTDRHTSPEWRAVLELDSERRIVAGDASALRNAIRSGADLRIATGFVHNEHIDVTSDVDETVREVSDFPVTYLVEDRWAAGIMSLRQPVSLSHEGFGRPSMSFFLYNEDGQQGIARPYLDGGGAEPAADHSSMRKYHELDSHDLDTIAPSSTFIYDFDHFRYLVRDGWREVLRHDPGGAVVSGSFEELAAASDLGRRVKVGIRNLAGGRDNEMFVELGPLYHYTGRGLLIGESRPFVRATAHVPMTYGPSDWDFGWLIARTDGRCHYLRYDPATLRPEQLEIPLGLRWFVER